MLKCCVIAMVISYVHVTCRVSCVVCRVSCVVCRALCVMCWVFGCRVLGVARVGLGLVGGRREAVPWPDGSCIGYRAAGCLLRAQLRKEVRDFPWLEDAA